MISQEYFDRLEQAHDDYLFRKYMEAYPEPAEAEEILMAFENLFNITIDAYGNNAYDNTFYIRTKFQNDELEYSGVRLLKYLQHNYIAQLEKPLTGYDLDEVILQPILDFIKSPDTVTTFHDLLYECIANFLKTAQQIYDPYYSLEYDR